MEENLRTWVTWEKQIRNRSLSNRFNAELFEFSYTGNPVARYVKSIFRTLLVLKSRRKGLVFVQNPSIVLALLAVFSRPFLGYKLIVDAHNAGISSKNSILNSLNKFVIKRADFTIVTNKNLAEYIASIHGRPLILPDPLPNFHNAEALRDAHVELHQVMFICSWAEDEPYLEIFKAAKSLPDYKFYITGKSKGKEQGYGAPLPSNIFLTGYLSDDDYHEMLATSGVVVDLTTRENCLVCGAYEATSLERPFLVSDTIAIRGYFKKGCLYVNNQADGIAFGVKQMTEKYSELKSEIELGRVELEASWQSLFLIAQSAIK